MPGAGSSLWRASRCAAIPSRGVDGVDGVHISEAVVDSFIERALNRITANAAGAVYASTS